MIDNNSKKRKFIFFSVCFFIILALSNFLGSTCFFFKTEGLKKKFSFGSIIKYAFEKEVVFLSLFLSTAFLLFFFFVAIKYRLFSPSKVINDTSRAKSNLYGQADFMSKKEMISEYGDNNEDYEWTNLSSSSFSGYVVKSYKRKGRLYIEGIKQQHCLVLGTNGTGKSQYFLIPTILANGISKNKPSMIINDLKGELFAKTSQELSKNGYNVLCINLRTPRKSLRFNPLEMIWDLYQEYSKTQNGETLDKVSQYIIEIAEILVPSSNGNNKEWSEGAQGIVAGVLWGMLEDSLIPAYKMTKDKFTFKQISNIINRQSSFFLDFLKHREMESKVFDYAAAIMADGLSEKTISSYLSTLNTFFPKFLEGGIEYITSSSDIDLKTIIDQPTAIFLIIPDESTVRNILANTIIVQLYNFLTFAASSKESLSLDRPFYFLLDEFGNMPKLPNFSRWISTSRGRNIFFCPILQANSQLETLYSKSEANTILDQTHLKIFMGSNEYETLQYFQKQLGTYTAYSRTSSTSEKQREALEYQGSTSLTKADLVTIDELQYKPKGKIFFTLNLKKPCVSQLVPFFDEELQKNGTFKAGALLLDVSEKPLEMIFYDLSLREENYINGNDKKSATEFLEWEKNNNQKKQEVKEVVTNDDVINTLDDEMIASLLGLKY